MTRRPLAWSGLAFVCGALFQGRDLPAGAWALLGLVTLLGAAALCLVATRDETLRLAGLLSTSGYLCAGCLAAAGASSPGPWEIAVLASRHEPLFAEGVDLRGRLASPPRRCVHPDPSVPCAALDVETNRVRLRGRWLPVAGRVRLRVALDPDSSTLPARGDVVAAFARLFAPRSDASPVVAARRAGGARASGWIKSPGLLRSRASRRLARATALRRATDRLRATALRALRRPFGDSEAERRAGAVAEALLLGERGRLDPSDLEALQESGLSHLLAVSGFNVAVLAGLALGALRLAGAGPRGAAAGTAPVLVLYWLLNQDESSVGRAVVMALVWLVGRLAWRRPDPYHAMGLSALVLAVPDPCLAFDPGFQLTFAATWSLVVAARRRRGARPRWTMVRWARAALAATLAAGAATLPLATAHFNRVVPGAVPANAVAGPLMAAAFVGTLAVIAAEAVAPDAAGIPARGVTLCVEATRRLADTVRAVPGMHYRRPTPPASLVLIYYGALGMALGARRAPRLAAAGAAGLAGLLLAAPIDSRDAPDGLRITMLDVGQGDAILIETRGGARALIDAGGGPRGSFDPGERVVARALWDMGLARLDVLTITHQDQDHAGGAATVVGAFRPDEVWVSTALRHRRGRGAAARLLDAAASRGIRVRELARGDTLCLRGACVRVLHPAAGAPPGRARNEESLVLVAAASGRRTLLPGDAGTATEAELASRLSRCEVLKVGHHGSRGSTSAALIDAVRPRVALISCGRHNRFGHPHPEVIDRLRAAGAVVCRTDRLGGLSVELTRGGTRLGAVCTAARDRGSGRAGG